MKAKVNLQLLKTTTFDSGALGLLSMVVHQFASAGRYRATVLRRGDAVADVDFVVDDASDMMQLDIDLARAAHESGKQPGECDCKDDEQAVGTVSPKGYVLFHVSSGGGYSVTVSKVEGEQVFDSTKLEEGDLFAVSLLEPGDYSMVNRLSTAAGFIRVSLPPEAAKKIRNLETLYIDAGRKQFEPKQVELTSSQGLVFRLRESARIFIEKKKGSPEQPGPTKIHWRKPPVAKKETGKKKA